MALLDHKKALDRVLAILRSLGVEEDNIERKNLPETLEMLTYLATTPGKLVDDLIQSENALLSTLQSASLLVTYLPKF